MAPFEWVPGEDVARVKRELPLPDEDSLAKGTLQRLRINPGADVVVLGSYTPLSATETNASGSMLRVQDTVRGETISEQSFTAARRTVSNSPPRQVRRFDRAWESAQLRPSQPSGEGRSSIQSRGKYGFIRRAGTFMGVRHIHAPRFADESRRADPGYPLSHAALADAWNHLGYATKARAEIERARALSEHLGPEDRC